MMQRRRYLMESKNRTGVLCLKASTTQWIDTKIVPDVNTIIELDFGNLTYSALYSKLVGVYISNSNVNNYCISCTGSVNTDSIGYSIGIGLVGVNQIDMAQRTKIKMSCTEYYIDGVLCASYDKTFTTNYSMGLFAAKNGVSSTYRRDRLRSMDCYGLKVWQSGELIADFIPWLDQEGRPCMFDTVSKQAHYNEETGEFGYKLLNGTIVNPV